MRRLAMYFSLRVSDCRRGPSRRRSNVRYALLGMIPAAALTYGLKGLELPREHMMAIDRQPVASLVGIPVVRVDVKRDGTTITVRNGAVQLSMRGGVGKLTLQSSRTGNRIDGHNASPHRCRPR